MSRPQSYQALNAFGLRHPPLYDVDELGMLPPDVEIYVRGTKSNPLLNQRYQVRDVLKWNDLSTLIGRGELIAFERSPIVTFGGATATNALRQTYIEVAVGHTSGLLHHGYCAARLLFSADRPELIEVRYEPQTEFIRQQIGKIAMSPLGARDNARIRQVGEHVWQELNCDPCRFESVGFAMTEWIYSDHYGIEFVDLKCGVSDIWTRDFQCVFLPRPVVIENTLPTISKIDHCMVGPYCSSFWETQALDNFYAPVRQEALLSHFFSYTSEKRRMIELI